MKGQKTNQAGITLVALVISIIVMLILAGISINAVVGENGIISRAQDAVFMQSIAYLQEQMNYDHVNKYANDELATLEAYIRDGWVERILTSGDEGTINIKYVFKKENLDQEWQNNMTGGEGVAAQLEDVYGVNSNLMVWYIGPDGRAYGAVPEDLQLDENEHIEFANEQFKTSISNVTGIPADQILVSDIQDIRTLVLNSSELKNLDDLYYFPNLKTLTLSNLQLENVNGLVYTTRLNSLTINGTTRIQDWSGTSGLTSLTYLDINGEGIIDDNNFATVIGYIGNISTIQTLYLRYNSQITSIQAMQNMQSKLSVKTIWFDGLTQLKNYTGLEGFTNLERIDHVSANSMEDISVVANFPELYRFQCQDAKFTDLTPLSNLRKLKELHLSGNRFSDLRPLKNQKDYLLTTMNVSGNDYFDSDLLPPLADLYNKINFSINEKWRKYLLNENSTKIEYGSSQLANLDVLATYSTINTLNLSNNTNLTNENMKWFHTNNRETITTLYLDGNKITNMEWLLRTDGTCCLPNLTTLSLYNCDSLTSLKGLEKCTRLTTIDLAYCDNITDSSFHNGTTYYLPNSVTRIYLYGASKYESTAGLANLSNLNWIDISYTAVKGDNANTLNSLTNIRNLAIGNNGNATSNANISALIPTINRCSTWFNLRGNYAGALAQQVNNASLTYAKFDYNTSGISLTHGSATNNTYNVDELDFSSTRLSYLFLNDRYVKSVKLPSANTLQYLYLKQMYRDYHFTIPDLTNYSNLILLEANDNNLNKTDFDNLCNQLENKQQLTTVNLTSNAISKISNIAKIGSKTSTKGITLNLSGNLINSLSGIEDMDNNIVVLDLTNNQISNIQPLIDLAENHPDKRLTTIKLKGNPVGQTKIRALREYYTVEYDEI